ncbi:MAG: DNA methylase [Chromatiaceae bacterium]|nr:DNA methylase [Chromatiaceae bacterium]MCF8004406.1 DNA methylase [Chromatiaceae bacterium]
MSIEHVFEIPFVAALALQEKQVQQNYRPIIAVHKWFARRPGTLFRALLLSELADCSLPESFYQAHDFAGVQIADPFMGGGTPIIEANRIGCDVQGLDINPMAAWIVREEIEHLDLSAYATAVDKLSQSLDAEIGDLYRTDCPLYGDKDVPVKYFLWVKVLDCTGCGRAIDLFPGYLIAENKRHPMNVLICPGCGDLNEVDDRKQPGACHRCGATLTTQGPARRNRCDCPDCGHINSYPRSETGPLRHRLFAIEYYNPARKGEHRGRFFKKPDGRDLEKVQRASARFEALTPDFVPDQPIPPGDETDRLLRWGYRQYRELFNRRQLLGLELSCRHIAAISNERLRQALATNLSDLLRYQNMLCRYDTMALKSLDIFSVHGFPVGLVQCESNILGIRNGNGSGVGSGGWVNITEKYSKAKRWCEAPFEIRRQGSRKTKVPIGGEWVGEQRNGSRSRAVSIRCASSTTAELTSNSLDAVFTDPPYFGNVQYAELMDFCYVWLRRLVGREAEGFDRSSTHSVDELTGNVTQKRDLAGFAEGLAAVYRGMAEALKPGAPLAFTYHHNRIDAYFAVAAALLDAGLVCSASLPCPAEMSGSIHIHGTGSSIIDTVFVCRATGNTRRRWLFETAVELNAVIASDIAQLTEAGRTPTLGDTRCIAYGHLTRMAIWNLRSSWDPTLPMADKLARVADAVHTWGDLDEIVASLKTLKIAEATPLPYPLALAAEPEVMDAVSF